MAEHCAIAVRTTKAILLRPVSALPCGGLSIVDLAGSHQPIANEDGTIQVIFNGEIYNYPRAAQI
jgi:asparagine synthetase B (glutamine-hydrolysing)